MAEDKVLPELAVEDRLQLKTLECAALRAQHDAQQAGQKAQVAARTVAQFVQTLLDKHGLGFQEYLVDLETQSFKKVGGDADSVNH